MRRRCIGLAAVIGAVVATAAPALAAGPANVTVRVEGLADTLVPRTALTTTTATVNKDGVAGHNCTGTSAAGALDQATGGAWSGPWFDGFQYSVDVIRGESHPFGGDPVFWGFFVNDVLSQTGLCGAELQTGDQVLLAPISEQLGASYTVLSLAGVPATARPGQPFAVRVMQTTTDASNTVTRQPVPGATVSGAGATATTGADGTAQITLGARGPATLRATHGDDVRSASEPVCVTDGSDGACGSAAAAASACVTAGDDGLCGTRDRRAPRGKIASIREGQRFGKGRGPRGLGGIVTSDPSGIAAVRLRLTRNDHGRCQTFDGRSARLVALKRCGARRGKWFSAGDREQWSYLLPARLGPGRYVLDLQVADRAGNVDTLLQRTRTRVVFTVS
ncbi:MAG TPA: hypothetical protein VF257_11210 [Solirubrobacteraceae bacterium]